MFTCGECADYDCEGKNNPFGQSCDEFTLEEYELDENFDAVRDELDGLTQDLADLYDKVNALEHKFNEVIAAVMRAVSEEV